jgi:hypothetical protein
VKFIETNFARDVSKKKSATVKPYAILRKRKFLHSRLLNSHKAIVPFFHPLFFAFNQQTKVCKVKCQKKIIARIKQEEEIIRYNRRKMCVENAKKKRKKFARVVEMWVNAAKERKLGHAQLCWCVYAAIYFFLPK